MTGLSAAVDRAAEIAVVGGAFFATVGLSWLHIFVESESQGGTMELLWKLVFAGGILFLTAAVPLYLLARFSLGTPICVMALIVGSTVYQYRYGTHIHPISSFFTVWPLEIGVALVVGAGEVLIRRLPDIGL
jgi:DMSO reductase anchor subunit